ncbi:chitinase-like protein Idgf4 [Phlebotomus argentipes]|uniref:chitinase-like protein Idgf4 n=1 Tax=Phlebotomus argentipes TaxID=94469 RepID=UPI002892A05F|nr:chitinase-like protein Idgf4 [Phlebotomus argentipes]
MSRVIYLVALASLAALSAAQSTAKVFCYYDSRGFVREGLGKTNLNDIEPALPFCTHLVYGYAGLNGATNKAVSLNENLDLDQGKGHYRAVTALKRKYPGLKILLGLGGGADGDSGQYLTALESSGARISFINSAYTLVKTYDFDGLDLSWQFPVLKPKKIRGTFSSFLHKIKKPFTSDGPVDEKWEEHREEFTALVRELKNSFRHDNYQLTLTVLPNVNSSLYFDVPAIINNLDYVVLAAYDFQTPERNPKEADYAAPLYELPERNPESNVNYQVQLWLGQRAPATKVVVGIPTFGHCWKTDEDSGITGVPPLRTPKEGHPEGPQVKIPGLVTYPEACAKLPNPSNAHLKGEDAPLRKVGDPTKRFGTYAFRVGDPDRDYEHGMWCTFEDPDTAGNKAGYVRAKGLGGIGVFDLTFDDFRGSCSGDKFPILRAAKYRL